jgi:hypothetical protein
VFHAIALIYCNKLTELSNLRTNAGIFSGDKPHLFNVDSELMRRAAQQCFINFSRPESLKSYILSRDGVTIDRGWIDEHLQIVTIRNYGAISNTHTLQFTTARIKSSQSAVSSPVVAW